MSPQNVYVEALIPIVMAFGDGEVIRLRGGREGGTPPETWTTRLTMVIQHQTSEREAGPRTESLCSLLTVL